MASGTPITQLLQAAAKGDALARNALWEEVYSDLQMIAQRQLRNDPVGRYIQAMTLVQECYLRLVGNERATWSNRRHFYLAAAEAMRRLRVENARARKRLKRGGGRSPVSLDEDADVRLRDSEFDATDLLTLDDALKRLESEHPRMAEIVKLRYFAGLGIDETAKALQLSAKTIDNEWRFARTWLHCEMTNGHAPIDTQ